MHKFIDLPAENKKIVWLPDPTWGNHIPLYKDAGFNIKTYKYYDEKTCGLNFNGMKTDVKVNNPSIYTFILFK